MAGIRGLSRAVLLCAFLLVGGAARSAPVYGYRVVAKFPHSTESYTEGFFYRDGMFMKGRAEKDIPQCS